MSKDIYLGIAYDALRGMGHRTEDFYLDIKPQTTCCLDKTIMGPAFTTFGEVLSKNCDYAAKDRIRLEMYNPSLFKHKPIVLLQANDSSVAHSGDITSLIYQKLGAVGFVTDGNVRDIRKIDEIHFPTFCVSNNPIDAIDYWALTEYQIPITIKGVEIRPNDLILADRDGVIRIKRHNIPEFTKKLNEQLERENKIRGLIKDNSMDTIIKIFEQMGRW